MKIKYNSKRKLILTLEANATQCLAELLERSQLFRGKGGLKEGWEAMARRTLLRDFYIRYMTSFLLIKEVNRFEISEADAIAIMWLIGDNKELFALKSIIHKLLA